MAINFLNVTNTLPEIQINDIDNNPKLTFKESGLVSGGVSTTGGDLVFDASSGIERARILSTGEFGIGTDAPTVKLEVKNGDLIVGDGSSNGIRLTYSGGNSSGVINTAYSSDTLEFRIGNSEKMRIDADGDVGIGIINPSERLHVDGNIRVNSGTQGYYGSFLQALSGSGLKVGNDDFSGYAFFDDNGNVGIGTDVPADRLHVKNADAVGGNSRCDIRLQNGLGTAEFGALSGYARIQSNGTEAAALSTGASFFYGTNWTFGSNLTTGTDDGKLTINGSSGTGGEAYLNLSRNNVSGFILNHTANSIDLQASANIPMFFYTNNILSLKINANNTITFPTYGAGTLVTDANGVITSTSTPPGTGTFLPLAGGTMTGTIVGPTAGNSSANPPALEVVASGTGNTQASIAIQQKTSEGDTIIFADYEPHVEWGISTENSANEIQFTAGNSTNSLSSKTLYNNAGNARTAYVKFNHTLGNGNTQIGGTLDVGQALTVSSTATANSFTSSTDTGISINGITMTRVAANSAIRVSNGLETLGLLRSYAGLIIGTSATIGSSTQGNTLTVSSAQGSRNTRFLSAGNGGYVQYESANDGIYGYVGSGSHLLSPVVNDNDFVARAQGEFVISIGATERLRINSSGNTILSGSLLPNVNGGGSLGSGAKQWTALNLTSGAAVLWANGDASIVEGEVSNYSLSFKTYDGTSNSRALLLEGNNDATFTGKAYGVTPVASDSDVMLATKKYVDDSITGGANYLGVWNPDKTLNSGYGNPSLQASGRTDDSGDYFICSADGIAEPNGSTAPGPEPNSWNTGDWVIWNQDLNSGNGQWQKIDNTTVLSGGGTTNSIAKFTDNETIGDSLLKDTGTLSYTTSNSELFQLQGTTASGYAEIDIGNNLNQKIVIGSIGSTYAPADWTGSTYIYNEGADKKMYIKSIGNMQFFTGGYAVASNIRMTIKSNGSVGIGTTDPEGKLNIETAAESSVPALGANTAFLKISNTGGAYGTMIGQLGSGSGYIQSQRFDGTATAYNLALQPNGGNVSIGAGAVGNPGGDRLQVDGTLRVGPHFSVSDRDFIKLIPDGSNTKILSPNERFHIENPTGHIIITPNAASGVGIGTETPEAKLDVTNGAGKFCVDSKTHTLTNAFTTCLTINLNSHTGCYVTLTCFGDWGSHSSAAYRGEFFLQNGANAYNEPGIILRQDDNTSVGTDQIVCQLLDPTGTGNPKDFAIQIRTTATTGTTSFTGQLTYTVQGKFNSIT